MSPDQALSNLLQFVSDATFIPYAVGLVVILTQLLKSVLKAAGQEAFVDRSGGLLALLVQAAVWVVYALFKSKGLETNFQDYTKAAETILTSLVTVIAPALLSTGAAHAVYKKYSAASVAGFRKS